MHVLVVTHLHSCVEIGDSSFIPFLHDGRLTRGSCLLVSHLRYASHVIPMQSQYLLCQANYRPYQGYSRQYHYIVHKNGWFISATSGRVSTRRRLCGVADPYRYRPHQGSLPAVFAPAVALPVPLSDQKIENELR